MQYEQSKLNGLTPADYQLEPTLKTRLNGLLTSLNQVKASY